MSLYQYVNENPWWTLIYIMAIFWGIAAIIFELRRKR